MDKNIQELWDLFIAERASPEQVDRLFEYIKSADDEESLLYFREALEKTPRILQKTDDAIVDNMLAAIIAPVRRISFVQRWSWAAACILIVGTGIFFWINSSNKTAQLPAAAAAGVIGPGRNGAVLTLADGSRMVLDSAGNGVIATQNGTRLSMNNGSLSYNASETSAGAMTYNTMTTPRGRQFHIILPDGTQVWLNAASSIRYPTVFEEKKRIVSVAGEAYFEVAADRNKPFVLKVDDKEEISVLGTSFNVNAYRDEQDMTTTLVDGSIRVQKTGAGTPPAVVLKPGQQALVSMPSDQSGAIKVIPHADIDQATAWKNGLFNFDNASLDQIMRQLERWYNIEVVYDNGIPDVALMGEITRGVPLDDLLAALKKLGVHYKQEGRKLIILR